MFLLARKASKLLQNWLHAKVVDGTGRSRGLGVVGLDNLRSMKEPF